MMRLFKRLTMAWRAFCAPDETIVGPLPSCRWPVAMMNMDYVLRIERGRYWMERSNRPVTPGFTR